MKHAADHRYRARGVSAAKEDVHNAIAHCDQGLFPGAFCTILPDLLSGSPEHCMLMHADGAGTKSALAYLYWREEADLSVWRGIAQDSLVMNLDDCGCVGALGPFVISNTIGRNAKRIPGAVIAEIIAGYQDVCEALAQEGIACHMAGGETADVGDLVRTIIVDSTIACRFERGAVIDAARIAEGDLIIGFSSYGQARWESQYNAGIGSNGLTGARHELLHHDYAEGYPETFAPEIDPDLVYSGPAHLQSTLSDGMPVGRALLSPTRTYLPLIRSLIEGIGCADLHALIHCSGGAQTKIAKFGQGKRYIKDGLPTPPPLFQAIAEASNMDWREMYSVYNCGVRLEAVVPPAQADACLALARDCAIDAWVVGHVENAVEQSNSVEIRSPYGTFHYCL